jgi:uncharacterized protein (DUF433 family)
LERTFAMPARVAVKSRRDLPAYSVVEAALYVRIAPATLRSWVVGREYETSTGSRRFQPLVRLADSRRGLLSFNNLVEAHVLRALRTQHGTPIRSIRTALRYAESELGVERLLLSKELCTDKRDLFLERYGQLINLSRSGQMAMRAVLESHLKRIEWDSHAFPARLYPFVRSETTESPCHVAIDPDIGFGRPILLSRGISTRTIVDRIDAGELPLAVADDYALTLSEVEEAVLYERAA